MDSVRRLEDAGAAAVVMYSLFEEQIIHESNALDFFLSSGTESYAEALTYFPEMEKYNVGPEKYLELVAKLKQSVSIPIIGSLNGFSTGGWVDYALKIEQAGADALELNIYNVPIDPEMTAIDLEQSYIDLVTDIRKKIHIPLAIKLSPFFSSPANLASRLVKAGANGLVMFNRFYQPDLDTETLEVVPSLSLSTSSDLLLPLRWTAILYGRVQADLALTGGVHTCQDAIKAVMAGAKVAMLASELIAHGAGRVTEMLDEMGKWMEEYEYTAVKQMRGSMSQKAVADPAAFERANYMKAPTSFDNRWQCKETTIYRKAPGRNWRFYFRQCQTLCNKGY
jgi:dihydroorotate dehydrogenase (fumarate)